jgi:hypothetical protein
MNYQDAIRKINKLLGLHNFNSYKIAESGQELISEGSLSVGEPVYIITDNGQLPAPNGEYELTDTTKIKIEDGKVQKIEYDMEEKSQTFVEATLKDGVVVKSPTFDVGEDIFVVNPDGSEVKAPDGEHELKLKDSEGVETPFKVIVKDGKIVERLNIEKETSDMEKDEINMGMTPDLTGGNDITEDFKKAVMGALGEIKDAIKGVVKEQEEMKAKVANFSKQPAGEPVKQPKNIASEFNAAKNDYISQLVQIRANAHKK